MRTKEYYTKKYGDSVKNERQERYYKRIQSMLKKDIYRCYWLTFTFSDKTLQRTTAATRLRYIKDFLNKQASDYVLNIDYGGKNNREHYHAFILSRYKVMLFKEYKSGHLEFKKAHDTINIYYFFNDKEMPTAENLTRHAFKDTTNGAKIIYSRKSKPKRAITIKANRKLKEYQNSQIGKQNKAKYNDIQALLNEFDAEMEKQGYKINRKHHVA